MAKEIKYSPDAAEKIKDIRWSITEQYGSIYAKKIVSTILKSINGLLVNEAKGSSVEAMFDIPSDYRYFYVSHNYVFYRIEEKYIYIVNIYNEKEDFMHNAVTSLKEIEQDTSAIAENSAVIAHNTAVTAYYTKLNAELTDALGFMVALK